MKENTRWTLISAGGAFAVFMVFVFVIWQAGFLEVTGADPNSKVVAAALALVGAFFGSVVTLTGILLKHSIDSRSEQLAVEAEKRLQLEAAIEAIKLFSNSNGSQAPSIQVTGALYGLDSLGQQELAIALLPKLLLEKAIDSASAADIIDRALKSPDIEIRHAAIMVLVEHAGFMMTSNGADLPGSLSGELDDQDSYVRNWAVILLGTVLAAKPLKEWNKENVQAIVAALALAWDQEKEEYIKSNCGAILVQVLRALPDLHVLYSPLKQVEVDIIRAQSGSVKPSTYAAVEVVERLKKWADEATEQADTD